MAFTSQLGTIDSQLGNIVLGIAGDESPPPPTVTEPEAIIEQPVLGLTIGF